MWRRELLSPVGANPLSNFDVLGTTQRIPTPAHGFCVQMVEGSPPTRIMIPKKGAPTLNLRHRYLILELRTDPALPFSVEIGVKDTFMLQRMLILSTECKAPSLAKGGGAKAKLPLVAVPPASLLTGVQPGSEHVTAGWRLAVLDLDVLVRYAFDGSPYHKLESVALVGACLAKSMAASAEPPQVQPPGPVRLVPIFTEKPHPTVPVMIGAGGVGGYTTEAPPEPEFHIDPDEFLPKEAREAREAARQAVETREAIEAAKAAEKAFLKASMAKMPKASETAVGFIPARDDAADEPSASPSTMPTRFRAAVRRLGMAGRLGSAPGRLARRPGDPRDHHTTSHGGNDGDDASVYKRVQPMQGGLVSTETATRRSARRGAGAGSEGPLGDRGGGGRPYGRRDRRGWREVALVCAAARARTERAAPWPLRHRRQGGRPRMLGVAHDDDAAPRRPARLRNRVSGRRRARWGGRGGMRGPVDAAAGRQPARRARRLVDPRRARSQRAHLTRRPRAYGGVPGPLPSLESWREGSYCGGVRRARADGTQAAALRWRRREQGGKRQGSRRQGGGAAALLRADPGQLVDLRSVARPPLPAACFNAGTNGVVEALLGLVAQPLRSLRHLHLGGNAFGAATRKEVRAAIDDGPNVAGSTGLSVGMGAAGDPAGEHASQAAERRALAEGGVHRNAADEAIALAAAAKLWTKGRAGTLPPEPSACSRPADDSADEDDLDLDPEVAERAELPPELTLQRSQTMSRMQNVSFALNGARVSSHTAYAKT